jgi:pilus assembly protein CpaF
MECAGISWLADALADPLMTDLCLNGTHGAFVDRGYGLVPVEIPPGKGFTNDQLRDWVLTELSKVGKTWDAKHPFVDASLPSGHRLHVAFPPLTPQGILVSIRKLARALPPTHDPHQRSGRRRWKDSALYGRVAQAVREGDSILISGATGSGKTTLASDLLEEVPSIERIIALEDTAELAPRHPHFLTLVSRPPNADGFGEVTLRTLLKQTLRMRPDRVVLGECRGNEVLELLQALNTGHRGALATLHANSPRDALRRIELLCLLASGGSVPTTGIRELLSLGIQWIAQVKRIEGLRKITELWRIEGREGDTILMRQVLESEGT